MLGTIFSAKNITKVILSAVRITKSKPYDLVNLTMLWKKQWEVDNERLCAMELRLRLRRFRLEWESNLIY